MKKYILPALVLILLVAAGNFVGNYLFNRFNNNQLSYIYEMGYDAGLKNIRK